MNVTIQSVVVHRSKSLRTMTNLSDYEKKSRLWPSRCDKRSGDPQVALIRPRESLDKCHDATEETDDFERIFWDEIIIITILIFNIILNNVT